ncbi:hypothetical protein HBIAX_04467 [Achromobacter xylosoxidans]|nr:hypothetical protein HBIAX_04467 [Achromobacter xylosoxidans]
MCGGIVQKPGGLDYVEWTFAEQIQIFAAPAGPRFPPLGREPARLASAG